MSPNEAPSSTDPLSTGAIASVPGKTFLLGEYAVLGGGPAYVATLGPRFVLRSDAGAGSGARDSARAVISLRDLHPQSPAGRLLAVAEGQGLKVDLRWAIEDPYAGQGGFGASTAQFALAYGTLAREAGWELSALGARRVYRELMAGDRLPPSGADLVAQWSGGMVRFDPSRGEIASRFDSLDWSKLWIFSAAGQAGRKVPTHEHLARIAQGRAVGRETALGSGFFDDELLADLTAILARAELALGSRDAKAFGALMSEYARALAAKGLELEAARADREAMSALAGVLGVKGTGALLADAVIVLMDADASPEDARRMSQVAADRGLGLIAAGLGQSAQSGWQSS